MTDADKSVNLPSINGHAAGASNIDQSVINVNADLLPLDKSKR
jgi:hypothetical protein